MNISYEDQVLALLYSAITIYDLEFITSEDLTNYQIKLREYFNIYNLKINLESSKEEILKFEDKYKNLIKIIKNPYSISYSLYKKEDIKEIKNILDNDSNTFLNILFNENIISSILSNNDRKLKKN